MLRCQFMQPVHKQNVLGFFFLEKNSAYAVIPTKKPAFFDVWKRLYKSQSCSEHLIQELDFNPEF